MLSPHLHAALRDHAESNRRSMAVEARRAIEAHIERERQREATSA
jgi:predicted transcriptional regulator